MYWLLLNIENWYDFAWNFRCVCFNLCLGSFRIFFNLGSITCTYLYQCISHLTVAGITFNCYYIYIHNIHHRKVEAAFHEIWRPDIWHLYTLCIMYHCIIYQSSIEIIVFVWYYWIIDIVRCALFTITCSYFSWRSQKHFRKLPINFILMIHWKFIRLKTHFNVVNHLIVWIYS